MNIAEIWQYGLRKGNSKRPSEGACLMSAANWFAHGIVGDNPPCACPVIRAYAIRLNDAMPDAERNRLKPFILRVIGNRDPAAERDRLHFIVLETVRRVLPPAFDRQWPNLAAEMRALSSEATLGQARAAARAARAAGAAWAAEAAWAAADARAAEAAARAAGAAAAWVAEAAWAAEAASAASAAAARAAAWAARAAARAAAAEAASAAAEAAARRLVWDEAVFILDGALRIGRQAPHFAEDEIAAAAARFERERVLV